MTPAMLLAAAGGAVAAAAIVELAAAGREARGNAPERATRSLRLLGALARLGRRAGLPLPVPADLEARLSAAGLPERIGPGEVMAVKMGAALIGALAALLLATAAPGRVAVVLPAAGGAAGFLAPDVWLARRARARAEVLALEVADVLDLVRVAVLAGMTPSRALGEVGRRRAGLLAEELAATAGRIALGVPRAAAYARLRTRCPLPEIATLVAALERADRHGAALAPVLRSLALDARGAQVRALHERAARAAPRIQLVVALVLVPAVLLLIAAALVGRAA